MSVAITSAPGLHLDAPSKVFTLAFPLSNRDPNTTVSPDGQRVLILRRDEDVPAPDIEATLNWASQRQRPEPAATVR